MATNKTVVDISRVRVKPENEERFVEVWADVVKQFQAAAPIIFGARLLRPMEGDVWCDVWHVTSKEALRGVMESGVEIPAFKEMEKLTELVSVEWYEVSGDLTF
ncbi:hypothetical protein ACQI4L_19325 [Mycolicibacterium litorale]|uniref:hypothetical protein n=1 Tax=Mycolicibacterium litorale TaxID=758802 RepID=UPI003CE6A652